MNVNNYYLPFTLMQQGFLQVSRFAGEGATLRPPLKPLMVTKISRLYNVSTPADASYSITLWRPRAFFRI
jgi:hypothetical protein